MSTSKHAILDSSALVSTRDALHAYAGVLGAWLKASRSKRKHWWHASLRPSLHGLTTGVVYGTVNFELELDLVNSQLRIGTEGRDSVREALVGQSGADLDEIIASTLGQEGIGSPVSTHNRSKKSADFAGYSADQAHSMQRALVDVAAAMSEFRAGVREETSPIQLWPHHFDLSMIWLPGSKVPGKDPADEENADKQMNFGFTFGDEGIAEPYFYVTAYPLPDKLQEIALPGPARWQSEGFSGVLLTHRQFAEMPQPREYLLELWKTMLEAGRALLGPDAVSNA